MNIKTSKSGVALLSVFLLLFNLCQMKAAVPELDQCLNVIAEDSSDKNANFRQIELKCLELLQKHHAPEERGKIYSKLSTIFSENIVLNAADVKKYSQKALEYPLEILSQVKMLMCLGNAIEALNRDAKNDQLVAARTDAAKSYLQGLKLVISKITAKAKQPLPGVDKFDYSGSDTDPVFKELMKNQSNQINNRAAVEVQNRLLEFREIFMDGLVRLYTRKPFNNNELEQTSKSILGDHDEVQQLIEKVKAVTSL